MQRILATIAALTLALALAVQAEEVLEYKGWGGVCNAGCTNLGINASAKANPPGPITPVAPERGPLIQVSTDAPPARDLEVDFFYSAPGRNGRAHPLDNGSILYDGDEFTIRLHARKDLYVYLFLIDAQGKPQELVSATGFTDNQIRAGQSWELPRVKADGTLRHFYLDNQPGLETIHLIVAPAPLPDLMADYQAGTLSNAVVQRAETKGILWKDDAVASPVVRQGPRRMSCPAQAPYCRETFTFDHRPASQRPKG